jgi:quercetin dioxygenase-like cupin family protein
VKYIESDKAELVHGKGYSKLIFARNIDMQSDKAIAQMIIMEPHTEVPPHYHKKTTELFYFLSGAGKFIIDGQVFEPKIGSILICELNEKHSTINENDVPWNYMAFKTYQDDGDSYWE